MIVVGDGLITAARQGVPHALERLFAMVRPSLFRFLYRMVANREDAEDLLQDCWIRAEKGVQTFRGGTANIKCWWLGIASNLAVDHLRSRKSWRVEAQIIGEEELASHPEEVEKLAATMSDPGFRYEVSEHAALCFACVGRRSIPSMRRLYCSVKYLSLQTWRPPPL